MLGHRRLIDDHPDGRVLSYPATPSCTVPGMTPGQGDEALLPHNRLQC